MTNLTVFQHDSTDVVDSRQVAELIGKNHKELLRDIRGYIEIMQSAAAKLSRIMARIEAERVLSDG